MDPEGWITALTPAWTRVSIPSTKGKKASEAATTLSLLLFWNFLILFIAILQLSSLLDCPDPIPIVVLSFTNTIALDFTNLQTLKAKIKFFKVLEFGFCLDTTLKSFVENFFVSEDCNKIELKLEVIFSMFSISKLEASIILKFFFFF